MARPLVKIIADTAPLEAALLEASALLERPLELPQALIDRLLAFCDCTNKISRIKASTATGADEVRVTFDASEGFRELLAALRAWNVERGVAV